MNRAFSLIELLVVVLIFTFLFSAILTVMAISDRSWRSGRDKLIEQQEARMAVDQMARLLRQSNPNWSIAGTSYPVTITSNNRIDFYQPVFDAAGAITSLRKITFKLNPSDLTQLLKKVGTQDEVVIANDINSVYFGGGCAGCSDFNCLTVSEDCPVVSMEVRSEKLTEFILSSKITLRNAFVDLPDEVEIEEPEEGEF